MYKKKSLFITFEGIEGSGKSYQSKKLYKKIIKMKIPAIYTREPGGTIGAEMIRDIIRESADDIGLLPGYDIETGYGRVNAYQALMLVPSTGSGDLNEDGEVNITDILLLLDDILSNNYNAEGDLNGDGITNINDIMLMIQIILN